MITTYKGQDIATKEEQLERAATMLFSSSKSLRERVELFESALKKFDEIQIPVRHEFIDGLYKREVVFPAGMYATGKLHKVDHMDVMVEGEMIVATPDGYKRLVAPCTLISRAGQRKAGIALKKTRWITYHPTSCTTVEDVEAEILCASYDEIELTCDYTDITADRESYAKVLANRGVTEDEVQAQVRNPYDQVDMPTPYNLVVEVFDSAIHGKGLFSCKTFKQGELIAPGRLDGCRTPAGRYTNHSANPNSEMRYEADGNIYLYALRDLKLEELTIDYMAALELQKEAVCQQ